MKLSWATDIHLNLTWQAEIDRLVSGLADGDPGAVLIAGDIAEAGSFEKHLRAFEAALNRPIYFVLGNHDFYGGTLAGARATAAAISRSSKHLRWMSEAGVVPLTGRTALVGHEGWGDARLGKGVRSPILMSDFVDIEDLFNLAPEVRERKLAELGDRSAAHLAKVVPEALDRFEHVVVLTHVPPFAEACRHNGEAIDDDHLPFYCCKAVGDALTAAMRARPDRKMTVLCGHTHSAVRLEALPNLTVVVGGANYKKPRAQKPIEVP